MLVLAGVGDFLIMRINHLSSLWSWKHQCQPPELQNFLGRIFSYKSGPRADGYKWSYINPIKWSKINGFHRGQHPTYVGFLTSIHGHLVEFYGKNQTWQARKNWTMKMVISYFTSMFSGHMCVFDPGCVWIWRFFLPKIKDGWFHTLTNLESTPCVSLFESSPRCCGETPRPCRSTSE